MTNFILFWSTTEFINSNLFFSKIKLLVLIQACYATMVQNLKLIYNLFRDGGMKGLFTGVGPRVGRAGPSVGIVVSFYEVVKYILNHQYA